MRARTASTLLAIAALLLVTGCGDDDSGDSAQTGSTQDFEITGTWAGKLVQEGLPDFRVRATVASLDDGEQNTVHYTGIDCSGRWTYEGMDGSAYTFREDIDEGKGGTCKEEGTVSLTPFGPDGVDYSFKGGGVESVGVLKRQG